MAKPTTGTRDSDPLAWLGVRLLERLVNRHARAKDRSGVGQGEAVGDLREL